MIELSSKQRIMLGMLEAYTGCTLVPANTTDETPAYPYISFSVINLSTRKGTYSVHTGTKEVNGQEIPVDFKTMPASAKYSFTVQAKEDAEALAIAMQVKDFFEEEKRQELADNEIIVADVGGITPRDNLLTMEYEYRKGLDVTLRLSNIIETNNNETVDNIAISSDALGKAVEL